MDIRKLISEELSKVFESDKKGIKGADILNEFPFSELPETAKDASWSEDIEGWGKVHLPSLESPESLVQIVSKQDLKPHEFEGPKMTHRFEGYLNNFKKKFGEEPIFNLNPNSTWYSKIEIINPSFEQWREEYAKSREDELEGE